MEDIGTTEQLKLLSHSKGMDLGATISPEIIPNPYINPKTFPLSQALTISQTVTPPMLENLILQENKMLKEAFIYLQNRVLELEQFNRISIPVPETIIIKEISFAEAKSQVKNFLTDFKEQIYPDKISQRLGIEFQTVMKIIEELNKEGEIDILD